MAREITYSDWRGEINSLTHQRGSEGVRDRFSIPLKSVSFPSVQADSSRLPLFKLSHCKVHSKNHLEGDCHTFKVSLAYARSSHEATEVTPSCPHLTQTPICVCSEKSQPWAPLATTSSGATHLGFSTTLTIAQMCKQNNWCALTKRKGLWGRLHGSPDNDVTMVFAFRNASPFGVKSSLGQEPTLSC